MINETDGIHIVFGMAIVPYILCIVQNNKMAEINRTMSLAELIMNMQVEWALKSGV